MEIEDNENLSHIDLSKVKSYWTVLKRISKDIQYQEPSDIGPFTPPLIRHADGK